MRCEVLSASDYQISSWSGGKTTQIYIHPPGADYAARNFAFRISSAAVELESSDFTLLPGIFRHIMSLEGEMRLSHADGREVTLLPYEPHSFAGGQQTKSYGKCVDFNLMLAPGWHGSMQVLRSCGVQFGAQGYTGVYARTADISVTARGESGEEWAGVLKRGDFLLVTANEHEVPRLEIHTPERDIAVILILVTTATK